MDPVTIAMTLAPLVPEIVGWLKGDKAKQTAEKVIEVAKQVTGKEDPVVAVDTVKHDPTAFLAFEQRLAEIEVEVLRAQLADTQDARRRDVELQKAGFSNRRADVMVMMDVIGLVACLYVLATAADLPAEITTLLTTIAGYFGLCLRDAHQFEFGSSRGSRIKDESRWK